MVEAMVEGFIKSLIFIIPLWLWVGYHIIKYFKNM